VNDIEAGRRRLGMTRQALWLGYLELGGNGSTADLGRWLADEVFLPAGDYNVLAVALNEVFNARGLNHPIGYGDEREAAGTPGNVP
jgi:hypothetical protein